MILGKMYCCRSGKHSRCNIVGGGVMVPTETVYSETVRRKVYDMIGLEWADYSSLEEMVHVAMELESGAGHSFVDRWCPSPQNAYRFGAPVYPYSVVWFI